MSNTTQQRFEIGQAITPSVKVKWKLGGDGTPAPKQGEIYTVIEYIGVNGLGALRFMAQGWFIRLAELPGYMYIETHFDAVDVTTEQIEMEITEALQQPVTV